MALPSAKKTAVTPDVKQMRQILDVFNAQFRAADTDSRRLLDLVDDEVLFRRPRPLDRTFAMFTCGEYLLRSAAVIEQTFGGLTTKLWDDPFEWTLPEKLSTVAAIREYFDEVDAAREKAFEFLRDDSELAKAIPAPVKIRSIAEILIDSIARSRHFQGRAYAVFQMLSDEKLPTVKL